MKTLIISHIYLRVGDREIAVTPTEFRQLERQMNQVRDFIRALAQGLEAARREQETTPAG